MSARVAEIRERINRCSVDEIALHSRSDIVYLLAEIDRLRAAADLALDVVMRDRLGDGVDDLGAALRRSLLPDQRLAREVGTSATSCCVSGVCDYHNAINQAVPRV